MESKICIKCYADKPLEDFHFRKDNGKHRNECKACLSALSRKRRAEDPLAKEKDRARYSKRAEQLKQRAKAKYANLTPEQRKANKDYFQEWSRNNLDLTAGYAKKYYAANKETYRARVAYRRAMKIQATAKWLDKFKVNTIYAKARRLDVWLGIAHHVDHIVPLTSDIVCGLHCEANLQILTAFENGSKNNRWWPDMWEQGE